MKAIRFPFPHQLAKLFRWERLKSYPELSLLCFSLTVVLVGWRVLHLPLSPPDATSGEAILQHYFLPLGLAIIVHLVAVLRSKSSRKSSATILGLSIPTLLVVTYCHFQCKIWMPLINPHRFGPLYEAVDHLFSPLVAFCTSWVALMDHLGIDVSGAYHGWFILLFAVCFGLHALYDSPTGQRQVILGVGWILALGGVSYWIAPAVGPFLYRHGADSHATLVQSYMWQQFHLFVLTRRIPQSYFLVPPAAMPSLHIAHAAFFVWMLRRISRNLSLLLFPALLWFMVTAVGLAWHYLLDIPAGLALAAFTVVLVKSMLPEDRSQESGAAMAADATVTPELDEVDEPIPA
jgi:hypothetical protein